ncbi:MAG: DUF1385 domain-containing protein [Syntrophomonadales bacterium]|jgi:uncharacterized protein YqhQ
MGNNFQYGGQAVIEGVMMRGPNSMAIAVRKPDGEIVVETRPQQLLWKKHPVLGWPLIRGSVVLIDSLMIGMRGLNRSAILAGEEEEQLTTAEVFWTGVIAAILAIALFVAFPTGVVHFTRDFIGGVWAQNLVEGILRILVFLAYVVAISHMQEIKRVFMYHGAEHKAVHTLEAGHQLSVENARSQSTLHPRCGTSFLLIVMVLSILVFTGLGEGPLWWRVVSRVAVFPVVAGLGYELIKLTSRYANQGWAKCLMAPGLWLQKLTTGEPDEAQMEVALRALQAVVPTNS